VNLTTRMETERPRLTAPGVLVPPASKSLCASVPFAGAHKAADYAAKRQAMAGIAVNVWPLSPEERGSG
jgi:hypothetical protein